MTERQRTDRTHGILTWAVGVPVAAAAAVLLFPVPAGAQEWTPRASGVVADNPARPEREGRQRIDVGQAFTAP